LKGPPFASVCDGLVCGIKALGDALVDEVQHGDGISDKFGDGDSADRRAHWRLHEKCVDLMTSIVVMRNACLGWRRSRKRRALATIRATTPFGFFCSALTIGCGTNPSKSFDKSVLYESVCCRIGITSFCVIRAPTFIDELSPSDRGDRNISPDPAGTANVIK